MARGGPRDTYTLENYRYFLFGSATSTANWNVTHLNAFWLTIVMSLFITILNFAICYPLAYYLAQVAKAGTVRVLMLLLIVPYWVNEILRAFSLRLIGDDVRFARRDGISTSPPFRGVTLKHGAVMDAPEFPLLSG